MIPYLFLLLTTTSATLFSSLRYEKAFFYLISIFLLIISAFRVGGTGTGDYEEYQRLYLLINNWHSVINPHIHVEFGFRLVSYLGNLASLHPQFIILFMAASSTIIVATIIYKHSSYRLLSLLVWLPYFLTMNMQTSRISVAAAFGLLFMVSFQKKNIIYSIFFLLLAISFHSSSLILILIFLTYLSLNKLFLLCFIAIFSSLIGSPFDFIASGFNFIGLDRYAGFINIYLASNEYGYPMPIYDPRILLGFIILFFTFRIRSIIYKTPQEFYFKIFTIGVFIMILFSSVTILAWRASYFFLLSGVLVVPWLTKIYDYLGLKNRGIDHSGTLLFSLIYFTFAVSIVFKSQPYYFFFNL